MQIDPASIARNLIVLGIIGLAAAGLLWFANKPQAPTEFQRQQSQGSLFNSFAINEMDRVAKAYPQCLYSSGDFTVRCPLNNSLHYLVWVSAGLLLAGLVIQSSTTRKPE